MESKIISATDLSPEVNLDNSGMIKISGKSRMEDASLFYKPAQDWVSEFCKTATNPVTVKFDLSYFNSSSAKQILKLLMSIDESACSGSVVWIYPDKNDTLVERGLELEAMVDLPFVFLSK